MTGTKTVCSIVCSMVLLAGWLPLKSLYGQDAKSIPGLKIPPGFDVVQVADDQLATNVYCLAVSPKGETFVAGPGYIKALIDSDGDGVYDRTRLFADGPRSGAQGMCFDGNDLLCTGDRGLLRFSDSNGDGVADGVPQLVLPIKCGGEHHAHAIRKGPDGWWYLLAGNATPIEADYHAGQNSPVAEPRAGFLMRISEDWSEKEIFAHGFRNAYDFDFNSLGQVFVYDSDGERDISLPWYRPTRLFQMRPGDDAGWVAAGWKRPSSFLDMPIEIGALGRGSPTGVVVGRAKQFPASYEDAIFVADWTFGRVVVFRKDLKTRQYDRGSEFAVADGQFGFAVTDLDFDRDGSLLVSVGGRGTQGAIYRISYREKVRPVPLPNSRIREFVKRSKSARLSGAALVAGLTNPAQPTREAALEALVGRRDVICNPDPGSALASELVLGLRKSLQSFDSKQAGLVLRIASEMEPAIVEQIDHVDLPSESRLILKLATARTDSDKRKLVGEAAGQLAAGAGDSESLCRIAQLALGGCGAEGAPQMFVGYTARQSISFSRDELEKIELNLATALRGAAANLTASQSRQGIDEVGRLAAMLNCRSHELQEAMVRFLRADVSSVPQQIHWLNCLSQTTEPDGSGFSLPVESQIAETIVGLGSRMKQNGLNTDRNFFPRMKTLVGRLLQTDDGSLAKRIAMTITGDQFQVYLFESLPKSVRGIALERFAARVSQHPDDTTSGQLRVLAAQPAGKYVDLIREFADQRELQNVVINALAQSPQPEDRKLFARGLTAADVGTIKNSAIGLRRLAGKPEPAEIIAALATARRLGWDKPSVSVRDQLLLLIQKQTGSDFGYQVKKNGLNQTPVLDRIGDWLQDKYPDEFAANSINGGRTELLGRLEAIDWEAGDPTSGGEIYKTLQCAQCHDAGARLGPRLEGIGKRFGRSDLLRSIVLPHEQVPERYRALVIETVDGQLHRGSVVYESVDGITLQDVNGNTIRLNQADIESRNLSTKSLMPEGLLNDATDQNVADLLAFLRSR